VGAAHDEADKPKDHYDSETPAKRPKREVAVKSEPSSTTPGTRELAVKTRVPQPSEIRLMTAKLHYLKNTGKPQAYEAYHALKGDRDPQRAWFHDVFKADPSFANFHQAQ